MADERNASRIDGRSLRHDEPPRSALDVPLLAPRHDESRRVRRRSRHASVVRRTDAARARRDLRFHHERRRIPARRLHRLYQRVLVLFDEPHPRRSRLLPARNAPRHRRRRASRRLGTARGGVRFRGRGFRLRRSRGRRGGFARRRSSRRGHRRRRLPVGATIRYFRDDDDRLVGAFPGTSPAAAGVRWSPAGDPARSRERRAR